MSFNKQEFHIPSIDEPVNFSIQERQFLLDLSRMTLINIINSNISNMDLKDIPPRLTDIKACFVTLTKNDILRGCIGNIIPREPLYQSVINNTQHAAIRDWRFLPVQSNELDKIKIEISILTEPKPLNFNSPEDLLNKLQPYKDGVILKIDSHNATFLPQVWKQLPDKVEFLNRLSEKACLDPLVWRDKGTSVSIYYVESFEEIKT